MHKTAHQRALAVFEARSDLGKGYVAILKVGVAVSDVGDGSGSLKVQGPVFANCFHRQKRDRHVLRSQQVSANCGVEVGDVSEAGLRPSLHATTPFISSKNRFSISRISSAMTAGLRGAL